MKISSTAADRVARLLLEGGPATAATIAARLGLTTAAVRRHLDALVEAGLAAAAERPAFGPRAPQGRGRPARFYSLTANGRDVFEQRYDDVAIGALRYLAQTQGDAAVLDFARQRAATAEARYAGTLDGESPATRATALVAALSEDGYAAELVSAGPAVQVCQHHCPVSHVAAEFPQLCEAETEAFARLVGSNVTRLATIAAGDGICTSLISITDRRAK